MTNNVCLRAGRADAVGLCPATRGVSVEPYLAIQPLQIDELRGLFFASSVTQAADRRYAAGVGKRLSFIKDSHLRFSEMGGFHQKVLPAQMRLPFL